jgi:hypothetical protein
MVKLLLDDHVDPNGSPSSHQGFWQASLMWAVNQDKPHTTEIAQLLLEHGAKPNTMDTNTGGTALDGAVDRELTDLVPLLVAHGADVNALDKNGRPPLAHLNSPRTEKGRQIEELLIKAGADADYNRRSAIWIGDSAGTAQISVFSCPTNSINHFTLLDFLESFYEIHVQPGAGVRGPFSTIQGKFRFNSGLVPFPDFARVSIHRLQGKRAEVLQVNAADILRSGDASKDVALQPGDVIVIPKQEHKVADKWDGLSAEDNEALDRCLTRTVQVVSLGRTNYLALAPSFADSSRSLSVNYSFSSAALDMNTNWLADALKGRKADTLVRAFLLDKVVRDENVLLNTWDLSRVRLKRGGATTTFDLTTNPAPSVWLEDGDVIEISELGEGGPAATK